MHTHTKLYSTGGDTGSYSGDAGWTKSVSQDSGPYAGDVGSYPDHGGDAGSAGSGSDKGW